MIKQGDIVTYRVLNRDFKAKVVNIRELDGERVISIEDLQTRAVLVYSEDSLEEV